MIFSNNTSVFIPEYCVSDNPIRYERPRMTTNDHEYYHDATQGRRRRSGRTASAAPLFWTSMLSAVSLFSRFGSFFFVLTSDFQFIDAIINNARCACHP